MPATPRLPAIRWRADEEMALLFAARRHRLLLMPPPPLIRLMVTPILSWAGRRLSAAFVAVLHIVGGYGVT